MLESAWETANRVRTRKVSAREATAAAIARAERLNPALNAFVHLDPEGALRQADAIDAAIARGEDPGPFAGVPIGVKDLEPVAGMPFTQGAAPFKDRLAASDSVQVARLKAGGAVVIGKTNTPEFGYKGFTVNRLFGASRNPWDPAKTPGGSSGGSAAAVAGGLVSVCTGSDGGGSVRIPAAFCGCYGIKPSAGRIPAAGETYPHWATHSTLGPLTRTVRDAGRYLDLAAGPHPNDLHALDAPPGGYEAATLADPPLIRRIAFSSDLGYAAVDPAVVACARQAAQDLANAIGAALVEAHPGFADPMAAWYAIGAPGDAHLLDVFGEAVAAELEPGFVAFAERARAVMGTDIAAALQTRHALNRTMTAFLDEYTVLLTPTCAALPFVAEGPPPRTIGGKDAGPAGFIPFTYPFNVTGHPAASVPAGLVEGLPVGLQIVGPRYGDRLVLTLSAVYEAACPWGFPPPLA